MTVYQDMIRVTLAKLGSVGAADPRHIEAWMREEHSTLDAISPEQFVHEVIICLPLARSEPALSEKLARAHGL